MAKRTKTYVGSLCHQLKYSNEVFKKIYLKRIWNIFKWYF